MLRTEKPTNKPRFPPTELIKLENVIIFSDLQDNELNDILSFCTHRTYPRGSMVILEEEFGDTVYAHVTLTSPKHDYENYVYFIIIIDDGKCFSNDFYTKLKETNHIQCDRAIISSHSSDINTSGDSRTLGINTKINEDESKEFVYYFPVDPFLNDHGTYFMLISYVNQDNIVEYIEIDKRHGIKI